MLGQLVVNRSTTGAFYSNEFLLIIVDNGPRVCKPRAVLVCDEKVELIKQTATLMIGS